MYKPAHSQAQQRSSASSIECALISFSRCIPYSKFNLMSTDNYPDQECAGPSGGVTQLQKTEGILYAPTHKLLLFGTDILSPVRLL